MKRQFTVKLDECGVDYCWRKDRIVCRHHLQERVNFTLGPKIRITIGDKLKDYDFTVYLASIRQHEVLSPVWYRLTPPNGDDSYLPLYIETGEILIDKGIVSPPAPDISRPDVLFSILHWKRFFIKVQNATS